MEGEYLQERHRDLDRFLTFVDAVAAIAITLLVLPLAELGGELDGGITVGHLLREHQNQIGSFLLSFAVIANLWFVQHRSLRPLMLLTSPIARLLELWTFTIVVLPFCTELVAGAGGDPVTKLLYFGAIGVGGMCLALVGEIMRRRPELTDGTPSRDPLEGWASVTLLAVALVLTLAVPSLSYYPLLLLLLDGRLARLVRRMRGTQRI